MRDSKFAKMGERDAIAAMSEEFEISDALLVQNETIANGIEKNAMRTHENAKVTKERRLRAAVLRVRLFQHMCCGSGEALIFREVDEVCETAAPVNERNVTNALSVTSWSAIALSN